MIDFSTQILLLINTIIEYIGTENLPIIIKIALVVIVIAVIYSCIKTIKNSKRRNAIALSQMLTKDKCIEIYYEMMKLYKDGIKVEQFNDMMMNELKEFLNQISEMFTLITKKEICATLRVLEQKGSIDNSSVILLQYSKTHDRDREETFKRILKGEMENEKIVKENTDYYEIIGENRKNYDPYFYEPNLELYNKILKISQQGEYNNTTKDWNKYYIGKIIVPIRMGHDKLFFTEGDKGYDLLGFLTIDSKSRFAFSRIKSKKNLNLSILETYSAYLYIILNKYKYYLKKLEIKEGMKKVEENKK